MYYNLHYDVIIIGAGAAGLMAAITAAKRGRKTLLLEASNKIGEKIRISGGGRCNFTNINASPNNYISENPHFIKSALSKYNQTDFIKLVESYGIEYYEKTLGQLFCKGSSAQIIDMLVNEYKKYNGEIKLECNVLKLNKSDKFYLETAKGNYSCESLIIATGGLSIPKIGATDFGYKIAKQFGLNITETKPALVPLTVNSKDLEFCKNLSGVSINSNVSYSNVHFAENILFTHRGLSGPAILQISSYIKNLEQDKISINLLPHIDLKELLLSNRTSKNILSNFLKIYLPKSFVENLNSSSLVSAAKSGISGNYVTPKDPRSAQQSCLPGMTLNKRLIDYKLKDLEAIAHKLHNFILEINGSEGYAKAEVTVGGVNTKELSSKTMESLKIPGLYFIGEVVDVTGWLGGYNFQWAWSSGHAAGSYA